MQYPIWRRGKYETCSSTYCTTLSRFGVFRPETNYATMELRRTLKPLSQTFGTIINGKESKDLAMTRQESEEILRSKKTKSSFPLSSSANPHSFPDIVWTDSANCLLGTFRFKWTSLISCCDIEFNGGAAAFHEHNQVCSGLRPYARPRDLHLYPPRSSTRNLLV